MDFQTVISHLGQQLGIKVELTVVIMAMALLMSRILPVIIFSPFLGGEVIPTEVKIGVGLTLGLVLFPGVVGRLENIPISAVPFLFLMLKELFIGLCLSFVVSLVFAAAEVAGTVVDAMAGTNMAQIMVPQIQQQVSLFSSLKLQLSVVLFLTLNGHHVVINTFADSLAAIPLDGYPSFGQGAWAFFELIIRVFAEIMRVGLALAAPVLVATFLTDLSLGLINRVAPQVQVYFLSMQIKPMVSVVVMLVAIHLVLIRLSDEFAVMLRELSEALRLLT